MTSDATRFRICFVCSGNICRSPMAEVVLRQLAADAGLADRLTISSAGTGDWHVGEQADPRAVEALTTHGYNGSTHRARQFDPAWFADLDLVVALAQHEDTGLTVQYLNRLSDALFVWGRWCALKDKQDEPLWDSRHT